MIDIKMRQEFVDCTIDELPLRIVQSNWNAHSTTADNLVLLKDYSVLSRQMDLLTQIKPKTLLEFGIFEGGSALLWSRLLDARYCGVDLRAKNPIIDQWIERFASHEKINLNFDVSQSDEAAVTPIVRNWLGGDSLDMVIDDASHHYEHSKRTFEIAFPMLRPGGVYLLEDWSWAHAPYFQDGVVWGEFTALSNLVFDLTALLGSRPDLVDRIEIFSNYALIHKSMNECPKLILDDVILKRGRELTKI